MFAPTFLSFTRKVEVKERVTSLHLFRQVSFWWQVGGVAN
jgi:hypothetical protein